MERQTGRVRGCARRTAETSDDAAPGCGRREACTHPDRVGSGCDLRFKEAPEPCGCLAGLSYRDGRVRRSARTASAVSLTFRSVSRMVRHRNVKDKTAPAP